MALTDKLSAIGVAIREKTGKSDLLTLDQMPTEIASISGGSAAVINALEITANGTYTATDCDGYSPITVSVPQDGAPQGLQLMVYHDCLYRFAYGGWDWFVEKYGSQMSSEDIISAQNMFFSSNLKTIPFDINFSGYKTSISATHNNMQRMFAECFELESLPNINYARPYNMNEMFLNCRRLRTIPDNLGENFDWSYVDSTNLTSRDATFSLCCSLRSFPMSFLAHGKYNATYSSSIYRLCFNHCYALDEVVGLPFPHLNATWTSSAFYNTVTNCQRLKNFTFALQEDGSPYVVNWKSQTIDLTSVGFAASDYNCGGYNSGITLDKKVTDDASYQALKDDPDWYTLLSAYCRYNHDSAVATINSLPDTSAYLATAGGTNTIKFKGTSGASTDGGAINTLTEEEIAVAAAKGWTVTLK